MDSDPEAMGGVPEVMPTNNWWDLASQAISTAGDVALARVAGTVAAPRGNIATTNPNPPPGGFGINPQAAATPGGVPTSSRNDIVSQVAASVGLSPSLVLLVIAGFLAWKFFR